ncbi:MAG: discoidin domain-containing protein [Phycisphaerales bacterium]|nr:discoidin domain-containing protein [Phycisphaerales bacterium]
MCIARVPGWVSSAGHSAARMLFGLAVAFASTAWAARTVLDDFESLDAWTVMPSDGVSAQITQAPGQSGKAMRLDFNFQSGAGFCVIRRAVNLPADGNYRFTFQLRGDAPRNNLEFKLIDASGENVWWVNQRNMEFPTTWQQVRYKARHFSFAWGPSGGAPLDRIAAIEFAVAASSGGKGSVYFDELTFEVLPKPQTITDPPKLTFSSTSDASTPPSTLPSSGDFTWTNDPADAAPWVELDLGGLRELDGLVIGWGADGPPKSYDVSLSIDGTDWELGQTVTGSNGGTDYIPLRDAEARLVRIASHEKHTPRTLSLTHLEIKDIGFAQSPNDLFSAIAHASQRGMFPAYLLGEHTPWTVIGVAGDRNEALLGAHGAIEIAKTGPSLEPFIWSNDKLITWADAELSQSLADGYLPIPTVTWQTSDLQLDITAFADGEPDLSQAVVRYQLTNKSDSPQAGALFVALRPFQVLPPWQNLNITGGVSPIARIAATERGVTVGDKYIVRPWFKPTGFGAATFAQGDITEYLAQGTLPQSHAADASPPYASAGWRHDYDLAPGETATVAYSVPLYKLDNVTLPTLPNDPAKACARRMSAVHDTWAKELNRAKLSLPPSARQVADTFRATQAYILINGDGPSIQPGSRTYERSWIRDGAMTSAALLSTGHTEKVKAFLNWYAGYQYPSGKVPCVVDRRGPDPVPEHDSHGELIYALCTYYRYTGDREFLEAHWPNVVAAVNYIDELRHERMTDEYENGPPEKRACYGLVPESISHEGYSAKPMHSYWDSFFILKGLKDAVTIAEALDHRKEQTRFMQIRDAYREALYNSIALAMKNKGIDYIPGCVELGDFDATSTAISVFPCGELSALPQLALKRTFDKYFDFFESRRSDMIAWKDYTPYELRIVGTYVLLDQPKRAHALLDFFFPHQCPPGWRQWAEVVWRDPLSPRFIGDIPHTWVGSAYVSAIRAMFVYESGDRLELLAGVKPEWLNEGKGAELTDFPTFFGNLSLTARITDHRLTVQLTGDAHPSGGFRVHVPFGLTAARAECAGREIAVNNNTVTLPPAAREVVIDLQ